MSIFSSSDKSTWANLGSPEDAVKNPPMKGTPAEPAEKCQFPMSEKGFIVCDNEMPCSLHQSPQPSAKKCDHCGCVLNAPKVSVSSCTVVPLCKCHGKPYYEYPPVSIPAANPVKCGAGKVIFTPMIKFHEVNHLNLPMPQKDCSACPTPPKSESWEKLKEQISGAHYVNLQVRKDGETITYEADYLKDFLTLLQTATDTARREAFERGLGVGEELTKQARLSERSLWLKEVEEILETSSRQNNEGLKGWKLYNKLFSALSDLKERIQNV